LILRTLKWTSRHNPPLGPSAKRSHDETWAVAGKEDIIKNVLSSL
jgi:hypothetical protein